MKPAKFLGTPNKQLSKISTVILPVPYEATTTYGKGAKNGPIAIIAASKHLELYDEELKREIADCGIFTAPFLKPAATPEKMLLKIYRAVKKILAEKKFPVILGGEHTVSIGAIKATAELYPDLSVLQLDAHADLRDTYFGSPFNHGCVMRRVLEITDKVASVGVRSLSKEEAEFIKGKFPGDKIIKKLNRNVYVTIDLDVFDPSQMPSVGTPEPGGLFWNEVLAILKEVFLKKNVIGFDVVELAPIKGLTHPDFLAAKLIYELIGYKHFLKH